MPRLAELLHHEYDRLVRFATRVEGLLRVELDYASRENPIYLTRWRIKSYSSLVAKLSRMHNALPDEHPDKGGLRRLLHEDLVSIAELFKFTRDLVGVRIVYYFERPKQEAALRLIEGLRRPWFQPLRQPNGSLAVRVVETTDQKHTQLTELQKYVEKRETRYTSIHIDGQLNADDPYNHEFSGLPCEIQIRTLFEEAWSELSHFLEYKGLSTTATGPVFRDVKNWTDPLEMTLQKLHEDTRMIRGHRLHPTVQLAQHYPIDGHGVVGARLLERHRDAYAFRTAGEYDRSLSILQQLAEHVREYAPAEWCSKLFRRLQGDIASSYFALYMRDNAVKRLADAEAAIGAAERSAEQDGQVGSFWAFFRRAELHRCRKEYPTAIEACQQAIGRIQDIKLCSQLGLESDVKCYLANLHWNCAYDEYFHGFDGTSTHHEAAIRLATEVYQRELHDPIDNRRNPVRVRASSLLLQLLACNGVSDVSTQTLFAELEAEPNKSVTDIGNLAWAILVGSVPSAREQGMRVRRATELVTQAESLLSSQPQLLRRRGLRERIGQLRDLIEIAESEGKSIMPRDWFLLRRGPNRAGGAPVNS